MRDFVQELEGQLHALLLGNSVIETNVKIRKEEAITLIRDQLFWGLEMHEPKLSSIYNVEISVKEYNRLKTFLLNLWKDIDVYLKTINALGDEQWEALFRILEVKKNSIKEQRLKKSVRSVLKDILYTLEKTLEGHKYGLPYQKLVQNTPAHWEEAVDHLMAKILETRTLSLELSEIDGEWAYPMSHEEENLLFDWVESHTFFDEGAVMLINKLNQYFHAGLGVRNLAVIQPLVMDLYAAIEASRKEDPKGMEMDQNPESPDLTESAPVADKQSLREKAAEIYDKESRNLAKMQEIAVPPNYKIKITGNLEDHQDMVIKVKLPDEEPTQAVQTATQEAIMEVMKLKVWHFDYKNFKEIWNVSYINTIRRFWLEVASLVTAREANNDKASHLQDLTQVFLDTFQEVTALKRVKSEPIHTRMLWADMRLFNTTFCRALVEKSRSYEEHFPGIVNDIQRTFAALPKRYGVSGCGFVPLLQTDDSFMETVNKLWQQRRRLAILNKEKSVPYTPAEDLRIIALVSAAKEDKPEVRFHRLALLVNDEFHGGELVRTGKDMREVYDCSEELLAEMTTKQEEVMVPEAAPESPSETEVTPESEAPAPLAIQEPVVQPAENAEAMTMATEMTQMVLATADALMETLAAFIALEKRAPVLQSLLMQTKSVEKLPFEKYQELLSHMETYDWGLSTLRQLSPLWKLYSIQMVSLQKTIGRESSDTAWQEVLRTSYQRALRTGQEFHSKVLNLLSFFPALHAQEFWSEQHFEELSNTLTELRAEVERTKAAGLVNITQGEESTKTPSTKVESLKDFRTRWDDLFKD